MAAATATAQTGAMVMTKGRIVSLFECETRSNARKTMTVPYSRRMNATITAHVTPGLVATYLDRRRSTERRPGPVRHRLSATVPSSSENS
jgi:hypothetical protein